MEEIKLKFSYEPKSGFKNKFCTCNEKEKSRPFCKVLKICIIHTAFNYSVIFRHDIGLEYFEVFRQYCERNLFYLFISEILIRGYVIIPLFISRIYLISEIIWNVMGNKQAYKNIRKIHKPND
jgi:hypothetical protein